jgi:hypothetical protein
MNEFVRKLPPCLMEGVLGNAGIFSLCSLTNYFIVVAAGELPFHNVCGIRTNTMGILAKK